MESSQYNCKPCCSRGVKQSKAALTDTHTTTDTTCMWHKVAPVSAHVGKPTFYVIWTVCYLWMWRGALFTPLCSRRTHTHTHTTHTQTAESAPSSVQHWEQGDLPVKKSSWAAMSAQLPSCCQAATSTSFFLLSSTECNSPVSHEVSLHPFKTGLHCQVELGANTISKIKGQKITWPRGNPRYFLKQSMLKYCVYQCKSHLHKIQQKKKHGNQVL